MLSNVKISGADGVSASGADMIKPFTVISISSNVSENICCILSITVCIASVVMPMPPIHTVSFAPMANREIGVLMRGVGLIVYPVDSNISRNSGLSTGACCGAGMVGATGAVGENVAPLGGAVNICVFSGAGVPIFSRGGRARFISGIAGVGWGVVCVGVVAVAVLFVGVGCGAGAVFFMSRAGRVIFRKRGRTNIYSPNMVITTDAIIDM